MPQVELIPSIEDREFPTSRGNWIGDLSWHGDTWYGRKGYVSVKQPPSPLEIEISLAYPYVRPAPKELNTLIFNYCCFVQSNSGWKMKYGITDGVYDFSFTFSFTLGVFEWLPRAISPWIPSDWNLPASKIYIITSLNTLDFGELAFDGFTLFYIKKARPDHLPVMGVG